MIEGRTLLSDRLYVTLQHRFGKNYAVVRVGDPGADGFIREIAFDGESLACLVEYAVDANLIKLVTAPVVVGPLPNGKMEPT